MSLKYEPSSGPCRFYDEDSEEGKVWLSALHGYLANITQLAGYSKVRFGFGVMVFVGFGLGVMV